MTYDSMKDLAHDIMLDNSELRAEVKRLKSELNEVKRLNYIANMDLMYAKRALAKKGWSQPPAVVDEDSTCECGECSVELKRDWVFCPGCGCLVDWDMAAPLEEDEGVAYDALRDGQMELAWAAREAGEVA